MRRIYYLLAFLILAGILLIVVISLRDASYDTSYAYPRFDGWNCLNTPEPAFLDKEWQITGNTILDQKEGNIRLYLRFKYALDDETHTVRLRVITPDNQNTEATAIMHGDESTYFSYPTDFNHRGELIPGLYTTVWMVDNEFVVCYGFSVGSFQRGTPTYQYEISHYGIQYLPSFRDSQNCNTSRIAGQIHNNLLLFPMDDSIDGLRVELSGNGVEMNSFTGSHPEYGHGGYEFVLSDQESGAIYYLQVFNPENQIVSTMTPVTLSKSCDRNLVWVNFEQVIFGK
jgi:hypothetical protein